MADWKVKLRNQIVKTAMTLVGGVPQDENQLSKGASAVAPEIPALFRQAAASGAVLLKNNGALPLAEQEVISVFGRVQKDWFFTGYGSGGDVQKPYKVNLLDGLRGHDKIRINESLAMAYETWCEQNPVDHGYWGHWPRCYPEMPVTDALAADAASQSRKAVVVIGRSSGEDRENALEKGSYYLTDEETALLQTVTRHFEETIVLFNIGSIMDFSFLDPFGDKISAAMIVWQGGMESGNAVADLLCGDVTPSGHLTATIAQDYEDYPSAGNFGAPEYNCYEEDIYVGYRYFETFAQPLVRYPFGYGLSYTTFTTSCMAAQEQDGLISFRCRVTNDGACKGQEVVQLYVEKPCGKLGNPSRALVDFAKTAVLQPGESCELTLTVSLQELASYDAAGVTGHRSAYVLEAGEYAFYLGNQVRDASKVYTHYQQEIQQVEQLTEICPPEHPFQIITAVEKKGYRVPEKRPVQLGSRNLKSRILEHLPEATPYTGDQGIQLKDVACGDATLEDFVAQLNPDELEAISRGAYTMNSPLGPSGNAGVFGGVLESLRQKGVTPVTTTDGPSGIRLNTTCSLMPIGTLLAATFDRSLVSAVYQKIGEEMLKRKSDVLLAPGINIQRNPLCGRNFEYFSEDPLLNGEIAAAAVSGLQRVGVSACPKHFACNNQEFKRNRNDSRLSERALREIYLKGFEICVKKASPKNIMTSYNKVNGVFSCYNYDMCTTVLRGEWDYQGCVMTDWWMRSDKSREFPNLCDQAYRVRAQVDLFMPGGKQIKRKPKPDGTLLKTYGQPDGITLGEMQRCAKNVLRCVLQSSTFSNQKES